MFFSTQSRDPSDGVSAILSGCNLKLIRSDISIVYIIRYINICYYAIIFGVAFCHLGGCEAERLEGESARVEIFNSSVSVRRSVTGAVVK